MISEDEPNLKVEVKNVTSLLVFFEIIIIRDLTKPCISVTINECTTLTFPISVADREVEHKVVVEEGVAAACIADSGDYDFIHHVEFVEVAGLDRLVYEQEVDCQASKDGSDDDAEKKEAVVSTVHHFGLHLLSHS